MTNQPYQLVHANLAQGRAALDDPSMRGFHQWLDDINASARRAAGFLSQPELPDQGKVFNGDLLLYVSIWKSVELLERFVQNRRYSELLSKGEEWLIEDEENTLLLYWIPTGETVTEKKIKERFDLLEDIGPSPEAFTFDRRFTVEALLTSSQRAKPNTNMT